MSGYQANTGRSMYAPRQFDRDAPRDAFPTVAPRAPSDSTGFSHNRTPQTRSRARSETGSPRNNRWSWATWLGLAVFAPNILLALIRAINQFGPLAHVEWTTSAKYDIDSRIDSLINAYAPFLSPSTPLLRLGSVQLTIPGGTTGTDRAWLEGLEDKLQAERWNLALTGRLCSEICSSTLVTRSEPSSSLDSVCGRLQERLNSTREGQMAVAYLLAGPSPATTLWVDLVQRSLDGLSRRLSDIPQAPKTNRYFRPMLSSNERKQRAAETLYHYVDGQGPLRSINREIRRHLLSLRLNCTSVADDLSELYLHYRAVVSREQHDDGQQSNADPFEATPVPVAHIGLLIKGIDDLIAALDQVDDGRNHLRGLLGAYMHTGGKVMDPEKGARTLIWMSHPTFIYWAIFKHLGSMNWQAWEMGKTWAKIRAADENLVECLREPDTVGRNNRLASRLNMNYLDDCIRKPKTLTPQIAEKLRVNLAEEERVVSAASENLRYKFPELFESCGCVCVGSGGPTGCPVIQCGCEPIPSSGAKTSSRPFFKTSSSFSTSPKFEDSPFCEGFPFCDGSPFCETFPFC